MEHWGNMMRPVALQASILGGLGLGAYALRRLSTPALHPMVAERVDLVRHSPALAATVSQLAAIGDEDGLRRLVDKLVRVVHIDLALGPAAQWQISRLNTEIANDAKRMCRTVSVAHSNEMFRIVLDCQNEVIPQMQTHLDNLLHNHLLSRSPLGGG